MNTPWFTAYKRNPDAPVRVFCFHCAGGSASEFRGWPAQLSGKFELLALQLPGREGRVKEAFFTSFDALIGAIVDAIVPLLDKPYVIFGHSFGALCAFEVIRELRRRGARQPLLLIPAGRQAPNLKSRKPPIASLPRDTFVAELHKEYGDQIGHVLANAELRDVFVPQIHSDFKLSEMYRFRAEPPLDCPISAFAGIDEDDLDADDLHAWSAHTSQHFRARRFPGDHFFIRESQALVVEAVRQEIASVRRERVAIPQSLPA